MKSVPFVALALALMATSALAQPRHFRDEDQSNAQPPPRAEPARPRPERPQPQPQAAPPQAHVEHNQGRGNRDGQPPAPRMSAPQGVAPQPQPNPGDRRDFAGRRGEGAAPQVVEAPAAQPPRGGPRQWQGDPRQRDGRDRPQAQPPTQPPANNGAWDGRRDGRDGRDGARDGRDGRNQARDGAPRSGGDRNSGNRDPNGWNRDGGRGGWDRDHRGPQVRPDWASRNGRYDRDRNRPRYDIRIYPHFFSFQRHFRAPYYAAPYGYYDYDWAFGDYLPWGWYGPSYWLENWWDYGLPPPPIGCEWTRVGRDAILVDTFDGRVLSVARLLFW